ncbi:MAG: pyruvate formate lyase family protein [Kiritimatiellia bacterium]
MTARIQRLLAATFDKTQRRFRRDVDWKPLLDGFIRANVDDSTRARRGLEEMLKAERPAFMEDERIAFLRTVKQIPDLHSEAEMAAKKASGIAYGEKGVVFNLTADFGPTIAVGLDRRLEEMSARLQQAVAEKDEKGQLFLANACQSVLAVLDLADRYRAAAEAQGLQIVAETLKRVPHKGARTFHEALQFLRILHYAMWCEGEYHCGLGRIDQYLYPYLEADLDAGRLTEDGALEELEEFFIACNRDSDLYIGVQQGDNGQSVMLGGCTREGRPAFNLLSRLALKACGELKLVDPKINLRVDRNTPADVYELGTELTKAGLGFPQYANDDVVIPALERWGYALEDARDYSVAACWEFLIPGCGMDINNIDAVSMPSCVDAVMRAFVSCTDACTGDFPSFLDALKQEINGRCDRLQEKYRHVEIFPGPFVSVISAGCIQNARDISEGAKYNNFGIHGTGIAVAVDSLAAIRSLVFEKNLVTMAELVRLVDSDFAGRPDVLAAARNVPKMGNADPVVDNLAKWLVDAWADCLAGRKNDRGGIYRPGTGSAMYYIWHAAELNASPCGRLKGEPFSANYAPSLDAPVKGPLSVIRSFTEPDLGKVCNGGPLTIEIHDSAFREADGVAKVAQLVKFFVERGGHQLQINAINRETLVDAQAHPDRYRHLIVRVWGWSGYFIELDRPYQDQVIKRVELSV